MKLALSLVAMALLSASGIAFAAETQIFTTSAGPVTITPVYHATAIIQAGSDRIYIDPAKPALLKGENKLVPGRVGNAIQFTGDDPVDLPVGNFERSQPFSVSLWLETPDLKDRAVVFHRSRAWTDARPAATAARRSA